MEETLLSDDAANVERDKHDDRHCLQADPVELVNRGGDAKGVRASQRGCEGYPDGAEHADDRKKSGTRQGHSLAGAYQNGSGLQRLMRMAGER